MIPLMFDVNLIRQQIQRRLAEKGTPGRPYPMKTASLDAGLGETYVRDILRRGRKPRAAELGKLAKSLGITINELGGGNEDQDKVAHSEDVSHNSTVEEEIASILVRGDMDSSRLKLIKHILEMSDERVAAWELMLTTKDKETEPRPTLRGKA